MKQLLLAATLVTTAGLMAQTPAGDAVNGKKLFLETAVMNAMATLDKAAATVRASQSSGSTRKG